jgi:hypothetical protein
VIGRSRPAFVLAARAAAPRPSWTFAQQVRLSIAVLLPRLAREVRSAPGVIVRMASAPSPMARVPRGAGSARGGLAPAVTIAAPAPAVTMPARGRLLGVAADRTGSQPADGATPGVTVARPLATVIASTRAALARRERRPGTPLASPALVLAGGATVLRRVHDERRRVEARTAQSTTTRLRPALQPTVIPPSLAAATTFSAPWVDPHRAESSATPSIDIPRLTDQVVRVINERIVAQHERMGRAY